MQRLIHPMLSLSAADTRLATIEDAPFRLTREGIEENRFYWLAPAKRQFREVIRKLRSVGWIRLWHPLLTVTRPMRHAFGLKESAAPPPDAPVAQGLLILADAFYALRVILIVVVLVNSAYHRRGIDQLRTSRAGKLEKPIVPARATNQEFGNLAKEEPAGELLGVIVDAGKVFCAVGARAAFRNMANPEFSADFGGARIVAEQKNFNVRMDALPTAPCIALDHVHVTAKGLRVEKKVSMRLLASTREPV